MELRGRVKPSRIGERRSAYDEHAMSPKGPDTSPATMLFHERFVDRRLDPADFIKASGHEAASEGRTHGSTKLNAWKTNETLATNGPPTHGCGGRQQPLCTFCDQRAAMAATLKELALPSDVLVGISSSIAQVAQAILVNTIEPPSILRFGLNRNMISSLTNIDLINGPRMLRSALACRSCFADIAFLSANIVGHHDATRRQAPRSFLVSSKTAGFSPRQRA